MDAQTVLVIILSIVLAVFLLLAITLIILLIRVIRKVRHITDKAEVMADEFASLGKMVKRTLKPALVASTVKHLGQRLAGKDKKRS